MKALATLLIAIVIVAGSVGAGAAAGAPSGQRVLADALHAMHARGDLAHVADHGRKVVVVAASQEAQWRGYVAASVYAAHGYPLHSVRLVRPKPMGDVTLGFPAVNCECAYPGMHRLGKIKAATRRQVVRAIDSAARREGARIDRVALLHPLAYAPVIVVSPRHPNNFVRLAGAPKLVAALDRRIEGAYIFVRGKGGRLIASGGYTGRSYTVFGQVGWAIPV
jgi:hypothetical protein